MLPPQSAELFRIKAAADAAGTPMMPAPQLVPRRCAGLIGKIHAGECVLVLGPRVAVPTGSADTETAMDDYLSRKLLEELCEPDQPSPSLRGTIARYEQRFGAAALRGLVQQLCEELDATTTDLHLDLAKLPFRLVLQATPDTMMAQAFRAEAVGKTGVVEACYNYCRLHAGGRLELPTAERPIVYSLFGRHDEPESMVLTDKNLLDYLVRITKESPPLPDSIRATLLAPSTLFLFIGFGFTNWWLRLLLKVLNITGVENRGLSLALEDSSSFENATRDNQGFFESAGIYIQAGDWKALARELAARHQENAARQSLRAASLPAPAPVDARRPLVFLSYASEDADSALELRRDLEDRGVSVWHDVQSLRGGENWELRIAEFIKRVDYFVFVQTEQMDQRDARLEDGVYNRELKFALKRLEDRPFGTVFVLHVTVGQCRQRPEPELAAIHRIRLDAEGGVEALAAAILDSFSAGAGRPGSAVLRQAL